jgi:hypothetical protein
MRRLLATPVLLAVLVFACAPAQASYDPIGSGTTKLNLDKGFLSLLTKAGVRVLAKAPARLKGNNLILPVSGGKSDPIKRKSEIEQEGTILFQKGNRKLPLRDIELKAKRSPLFAKVGGGQLKIASAKSIAFGREGFGSSLQGKGLELTQKVATRLNKKLRSGDLFHEGLLLGTVKSQIQPERVAILPQGQATLVPTPQILAKFKALFVSLNPISPAELSPGPVLQFPIAGGGQLAPDASGGTLRLGGAVELLQLGAGQVFQKEYWLDFGAKDASSEVDVEPTPAFPGRLGRVGVLSVDIGQAAVSADPKSRTISVANAPLSLDAQTAQTFNEAFAEGKAAFGAGEVFGTVSFGAVGQ